MFNNLIESRSHSCEFKRRGSFFLYTIAAYSLLFIAAGVGSIYAYDAHLDEAATESFITMLPPVQADLPKPIGVKAPVKTSSGANATPGVSERRNPTADVSQPIVPTKVSGERNTELPLPHGSYKVGDQDIDRAGIPGQGPGGSGNDSTANPGAIAIELGTPPPLPPVKKPIPPPIIKKSYVLNSTALQLPKPEYPAPAKIIHVSGLVSVQVVIDETGKVISAHVASGHPLLAPAAVRAAYQARFSPTVVGDTKVKVSGIINYNFVLE